MKINKSMQKKWKIGLAVAGSTLLAVGVGVSTVACKTVGQATTQSVANGVAKIMSQITVNSGAISLLGAEMGNFTNVTNGAAAPTATTIQIAKSSDGNQLEQISQMVVKVFNQSNFSFTNPLSNTVLNGSGINAEQWQELNANLQEAITNYTSKNPDSDLTKQINEMGGMYNQQTSHGLNFYFQPASYTYSTVQTNGSINAYITVETGNGNVVATTANTSSNPVIIGGFATEATPQPLSGEQSMAQMLLNNYINNIAEQNESAKILIKGLGWITNDQIGIQFNTASYDQNGGKITAFLTCGSGQQLAISKTPITISGLSQTAVNGAVNTSVGIASEISSAIAKINVSGNSILEKYSGSGSLTSQESDALNSVLQSKVKEYVNSSRNDNSNLAKAIGQNPSQQIINLISVNSESIIPTGNKTSGYNMVAYVQFNGQTAALPIEISGIGLSTISNGSGFKAKIGQVEANSLIDLVNGKINSSSEYSKSISSSISGIAPSSLPKSQTNATAGLSSDQVAVNKFLNQYFQGLVNSPQSPVSAPKRIIILEPLLAAISGTFGGNNWQISLDWSSINYKNSSGEISAPIIISDQTQQIVSSDLITIYFGASGGNDISLANKTDPFNGQFFVVDPGNNSEWSKFKKWTSAKIGEISSTVQTAFTNIKLDIESETAKIIKSIGQKIMGINEKITAGITGYLNKQDYSVASDAKEIRILPYIAFGIAEIAQNPNHNAQNYDQFLSATIDTELGSISDTTFQWFFGSGVKSLIQNHLQLINDFGLWLAGSGIKFNKFTGQLLIPVRVGLGAWAKTTYFKISGFIKTKAPTPQHQEHWWHYLDPLNW